MNEECYKDMTKRLLSLAMILALAVVAWADDITTVSKRTQWTFDSYGGQTSEVYNYNGSGIYLHSSQTGDAYTDFTTETSHLAATSGTFTGTSSTWTASAVLVSKQGVGEAFSSLGSADASAVGAPGGSIAFEHSVEGKLYVVYGATSVNAGKFQIMHRGSSETTFTPICEANMDGLDYTGPLGSRQRTARASEYKYSIAEASVTLTEAGTVYIGGTQPYCIYAILFVPNLDVSTGVPVILVAGQSNTDGRIKTTETVFPFTLNHTLMSYCNGVDYTSEGSFSAYGTTPKSDSGESWGYDAIIYNKVEEALGGNTDYYVIKQSKGNTAVNLMCNGNGQHWWSANPVWLDRNTSANEGGRSLLKGLFGNIDKSLKVLEDAEKAYDIKFLMWHQGEGDRGKQNDYEKQMKAVINEIRNFLVERTGNNKYSNLPVILGGVADVSSEYSAGVETSKQNLAAADGNIYYAPTGTMTLDEDFRSDKVHFNATGAEKIANAVWAIITGNNLMKGITTAGTDTKAANPLKEDVVSETQTFTFDAAETVDNSKSYNGLYVHGIKVQQKNYGTVTFADGTTADATFAAQSSGADRSAGITERLTGGNGNYTRTFGINVGGEGTFMAIVRGTSTTDYIRLKLNGEEVQAVPVTTTDGNIQLIGKATDNGTFFITNSENNKAFELLAARFVAGVTEIETVTAPTIGEGETANSVKITAGTSDKSGVTLTTYYTTDGSIPTTSSNVYEGEFTLNADCTVNALTVSTGGSQAYSAPYTFTYQAPTAPVHYNFYKLYADDNAYDLQISSDKETIYYYNKDASTPNTSGNFYRLGATNGTISWREGSIKIGESGLQPTNDNRPFAICGLKKNDVIRIEFAGSIYYAKNDTKGTALKEMTAGAAITSMTAYTVGTVDATNNYVVFYPTKGTSISQISINKELTQIFYDEYWISPEGSDDNAGTAETPFKTLLKAQKMVQAGQTIHIKAGTYHPTLDEVMTQQAISASNPTHTVYNIIYHLQKNNVRYIGETSSGQRPVFDLSNVYSADYATADNRRITGFLLAAEGIVIKNIDVTGIRVPVTAENTQSENFRLYGATNCLIENCRAYESEGIGFYIHGTSKGNLIQDCDAFDNMDHTNRLSDGIYAGENNDGFGCHVSKDCEGNRFVRCRAWWNADDGFDLKNCNSVTEIDSCVAYQNGMAHYPDASNNPFKGNLKKSGNGNGIKAGGFGYNKLSLDDNELPQHVVKNCIAAENRASGFYSNHHIGGLMFDANRAYKNASDFSMTNRSLESKGSDLESGASEMNVDGYGHTLTNNLSYGTDDIAKVICNINGTKCNVIGNSFSYQGGTWINTLHEDSHFESVTVSDIIAARNVDGTLPDAVFSFLKLKAEYASPAVASPTVTTTVETLDKTTYTVTFAEGATLWYRLPGEDSFTQYVGTSPATIEVTEDGQLLYYAQVVDETTGKVSVSAPVSITVKLNHISKPSLGSGTIDESGEKTIYKLTNTHYAVETEKGEEHTSKMCYILPEAPETVNETTEQSVQLTISKGGHLTAYTLKGTHSSDTLTVNVYAPSPAIEVDGLYDFTTLKNELGADYIDYNLGKKSETAIAITDNITLYKPSPFTAKTFNEKFAFNQTTDWRLLNAGRLRAQKTENADTMAILNVKAGEYIVITYSGGAALNYSTDGTARLGIDNGTTLVTKAPYKVSTSGHLLLTVPANTDSHCDITVIDIAKDDSVSIPTFELSESKINQITINPGKSRLNGEVILYYYTIDRDNKKSEVENSTKKKTITVDENCTIVAYCVSSLTGKKSKQVEYYMTLPAHESAEPKAFDMTAIIEEKDSLTFDNEKLTVYVAELQSDDTWESKKRSDFYAVKELDSQVSVRAGKGGVTIGSDGSVRLTRPMAIHNLAEGDSVIISYSGDGMLLSAAATEGEQFAVNGKVATAGTAIPSGAVIKVTREKYENNYITVVPSGKVFINGIFINHPEVEKLTEPTLTLKDPDIPNVVRIRAGKSSLGKSVTVHYTVDGTEPTATRGNKVSKFPYDLTVDTTCTVKAVTVSETGIISKVASLKVEIPKTDRSLSAVYDIQELTEQYGGLTFGDDKLTIYNKEYNSESSAWETKQRTDFYAVTNMSSKVSIRTGEKGITIGSDGSVRLTRPMAIHNLAEGDSIIITYSGDGTLMSAAADEADVFTVNGGTGVAGTTIASGATITVTKQKYGNNYVVVTPSGKVFLTAIYINHAIVEKLTEPTISLKSDDIPNIIRIRAGKSSIDSTVVVRYTTDGSEPTANYGEKAVKFPFDFTINESCTVKAISVSSTGLTSKVTFFEAILPKASPSAPAAYTLITMMAEGDSLSFNDESLTVLVSELQSDSSWVTKKRNDFNAVTNMGGKVSIRGGASGITIDEDGNVRLTRPLAIHQLAEDDEVIITYTGDGTLVYATDSLCNKFSIDGESGLPGTAIPTDALLRITKERYGNNYIVVSPQGKVYITGIYINHAIPELPKADPSEPAAYTLADMLAAGDSLSFSDEKLSILVSELQDDNTWATKKRSDFYAMTSMNKKISVRTGANGITIGKDGSVRLTRAMAIHALAEGDEIIITYTGDGTLVYATDGSCDQFTVDGILGEPGSVIPTEAVLKITKEQYGKNYIVVSPQGKVYITGIYINHEAPRHLKTPTVELTKVEDGIAFYAIKYDEGAMLHYILENEGIEMEGSTTGRFVLQIEKTDHLEAWTTQDDLKSEVLTMTLNAPTPAPNEDGNFDFGETNGGLESDMEVTLDEEQSVTVDGIDLYMPSALTAATFNNQFAFSQTTTNNKIRLRTNKQLTFAKGEDMMMVILGLKQGDIIAVDYTGTIEFTDMSNVTTEQTSVKVRAASSADNDDLLVSNMAYIVKKDCDLLLRLCLAEASVNISKLIITSPIEASTPSAFDFITASEGYETLEKGGTASVYRSGKSGVQAFEKIINESDDLPVKGKLSIESGSGEITADGLKAGGRHLAIHNLAVGDTIRIRYFGGVLSYANFATKGDEASVNGRTLSTGDILQPEDVIVIDKVDYLNNYIVLKLDSKCLVSGIFINQKEKEKVLMPTIVESSTKNTLIITAGRSTTGGKVTTCYTTDGSDPTLDNGTSGPYESFDIELLYGGLVVVKAVSYSETGVMSQVASIVIYASDLTSIFGVPVTDGKTPDIYDLKGRKVTSLQSGKIYIMNGKKFAYKKN